MNDIKFRVTVNPNGCFRVDFAYPHPVSKARVIETQNLNIPATIENLTNLVEHIIAHIAMLEDNIKKAKRNTKKQEVK